MASILSLKIGTTHCLKRVTRWSSSRRSLAVKACLGFAANTGPQLQTDSDKITVTREFGLSHDDFFRIFPRVWPEYETVGERRVRLNLGPNTALEVQLSEQKYRRLATLKIPYMDIEFEFTGANEVQRIEFFEKFERKFQKGGG